MTAVVITNMNANAKGKMIMSDQKEVIEAEVIDHQKRFDLVETGDNLPAFTPMTMIGRAMATGADVDQLAKFWDLQVKYEEREAKKAYARAMAEFKTENIKVFKDSHVEFNTSKGVTKYDHASLGNFVAQVACKLSNYELSHSWSMSQEAGQITVTCTISHVDGHSESVSMSAGADDSGGKNKIQAVASTNSYLQRYTFKAILGLAEHDNDGKGADPEPVDVINECQLADLEALAEEVGVKVDKFCTFLKVSSLEFLPVAHYDAAVKSLEKRRAK